MSSLAPPPLGNQQPAKPSPSVENFRPPTQIRFEVEQVSPHNYLYVTNSDTMQIVCCSSTAGIGIVVNFKILRPDGTITVSQEQSTTVALPATATILAQLTEGFLMNVAVGNTGPNITRGDLFVTGILLRGRGNAATVNQCLFQGYATRQNRINWPYTNADAGSLGPGKLFARTIANPAAGVDWQFALPAYTRARLTGVVATFTTSAVVNNRLPTLVIDDGVNIIYEAPSPSTQAAALGVRYSWGSGVTATLINGSKVVVSLPVPAFIPVNGRFRSLTPFMDAGDQWSAISASTEEWIDL